MSQRSHRQKLNLQKSAVGVCSICQQKDTRLVADHDHVSGETRGAICNGCNTGLGFFQDNPVVLRRAAKYVRLHAERIRLERKIRLNSELKPPTVKDNIDVDPPESQRLGGGGRLSHQKCGQCNKYRWAVWRANYCDPCYARVQKQKAHLS